MKVGDKIYFAEEKRPYIIRACDGRFLICTKPFNLRPKTVQYTIVDLVEGVRGTDGYLFSPYDYYNQEDCQASLKELQEAQQMKEQGEKEGIVYIGDGHISYRNRIRLNIIPPVP